MLAAAGAAALTLGLVAGSAVAHGFGHSTSSAPQQVTLDLSGAKIYDASAVKRDCHTGTGTSASTTTLSTVQQGDVVTAVLAVIRSTARQDIESGTAVPVVKRVRHAQNAIVADRLGCAEHDQPAPEVRRPTVGASLATPAATAGWPRMSSGQSALGGAPSPC